MGEIFVVGSAGECDFVSGWGAARLVLKGKTILLRLRNAQSSPGHGSERPF